MRKCFATVVVLVLMLNLFVSCSKSNDDLSDDGKPAEKDKVVFCDSFGYGEEDDSSFYGLIGYSELEKASGLKICGVNFLPDQQQIKILAGDTDVDIYFISASLARMLKDNGIYTVIESEKIKQFNSECFDFLNDFTMTDSGETVLMPVYLAVSGLAYPESAAKDVGFERSDILYYDSMMELVKNYQGERVAYSSGNSFFANMELQYEHFYCDFANGKFDYLTDEYKKLYKTLEGWQRYGNELNPAPAPPYFVNPNSNGKRAALNDTESVLLYETAFSFMLQTVRNIEGWRAAPMPRMSDKVTANFVNAAFAYVNPYSKNKEAAIKALEVLADNFYDMLGLYPYSILKKDKSVYPEIFKSDTQLFDDFYNIVNEGFLADYQLFTAHNDIEEYQNGRITLDEAVEMYQREINIWLNE